MFLVSINFRIDFESRRMLLVPFHYADLQLFCLNEWFLIKHEHSLQVPTTKEGANKTLRQGKAPPQV